MDEYEEINDEMNDEEKYLQSLNHVFLEWFNIELAKKILKEEGFYVFEVAEALYSPRRHLKTDANVSQLREMFSAYPETFCYPHCSVVEPGETFAISLIDSRWLSEWELRSGTAE